MVLSVRGLQLFFFLMWWEETKTSVVRGEKK